MRFRHVLFCVVCFASAGQGIGAESGAGPTPDPVPIPPRLTAEASPDAIAAEIVRLEKLLEASPTPPAERESIDTLRAAGLDVSPMTAAERIDLARKRQRAAEDAERAAAEEAAAEAAARAETERAAAIDAARARLVSIGYDIRPAADLAEIAEQPEPRPEPAGPVYGQGQLALLELTRARNARLTPHPALMASAQRLANYHATSGRWGHSSRSWRGNASENIAWNSGRGPAGLADQWRSSRGHWSNWQSSWQYVGVGYAVSSSGRVYGVQHFSNAPTGATASSPTLGNVTRRYGTRRGLFARLRARR